MARANTVLWNGRHSRPRPVVPSGKRHTTLSPRDSCFSDLMSSAEACALRRTNTQPVILQMRPTSGQVAISLLGVKRTGKVAPRTKISSQESMVGHQQQRATPVQLTLLQYHHVAEDKKHAVDAAGEASDGRLAAQ